MSVFNLYPTINPTLSFDFVNARALDPSITFTRNTSATYFDETGILRVAGANVPRLDYDPATLAARGFLIEEARTNLLLQSADFTTTWTQTNVTITANTTTSPDGGTNGDTLLINAAGATTSQTSQSFAAGSTITVSVFAKKNASNFVRFEVGGLVSCWFDLNTGVTGTNSAGSGNVLFSAKSIQAISNGWYRCVLTVTTSTITTLGVNIFATNADNVSSSISSSIFLWGAQAEVGAFPTSYIPTTTTALTRTADVASVNTVSPWYRADEGTLYAEFSASANANTVYAALNNGTLSQNSVYFDNDSGVIRNVVFSSSSAQAAMSTGAIGTVGAINKIAGAYALNNFAVSRNGGAVVTDTSGAVPVSVSQLALGRNPNAVASTYISGYLRRVTYYPSRLSNAQLQALTA